MGSNKLTLVYRANARDPKAYSDPEVFNPERFLKDGKLDTSVMDPDTVVFGYGRRCVRTRIMYDSPRLTMMRTRVCPGRYFAQAAIFITISSVLHTFSITPPLDEDGKPIDLIGTVKMTFGVIS